jgi:hypothetical protein
MLGLAQPADPHHATAETIKRAAQQDVVAACIRRNAYLLAKSGSGVGDIANAVIVECHDVVEREIDAQPQPADPTTAMSVNDLRRQEFQKKAAALVVEAKAGRCWAQGPGRNWLLRMVSGG